MKILTRSVLNVALVLGILSVTASALLASSEAAQVDGENTKIFTYDAFGFLASVSTQSAGGTKEATAYTYDSAGHLVHVSSPTGERDFTPTK